MARIITSTFFVLLCTFCTASIQSATFSRQFLKSEVPVTGYSLNSWLNAQKKDGVSVVVFIDEYAEKNQYDTFIKDEKDPDVSIALVNYYGASKKLSAQINKDNRELPVYVFYGLDSVTGTKKIKHIHYGSLSQSGFQHGLSLAKAQKSI